MEAMLAPRGAYVEMSGVRRRLAWLEMASRQLDEDGPTHPQEREAWETLRRHAVRTLYAERHALREEARIRQAQALQLANSVPLESEYISSPRLVARKLIARDIQGILKSLYWISDRFDEPRLEIAYLMYKAACLLREAGQLEASYYLYGRTWMSWGWWDVAPPDERYLPPPYWWRHGVPRIYRNTRATLTWDRRVPRVEQVDWRWWDHVIGCATQVDQRVLDALAVPSSKQIVLEVHNWLPFVSGVLPRLSGRVVVVDDVNEGETSQVLARLYDADVVAIGRGGAGVAGIFPVMTVSS